MYDDMFRISYGFQGCQSLTFIAAIKVPHNNKVHRSLKGFRCNAMLGRSPLGHTCSIEHFRDGSKSHVRRELALVD